MTEPKKPPEGEHLILPVYTRRWDRADDYHLWVTEDGWYIQHIVHNGHSDPTGYPYLGHNFKQDNVDDPGVASDMSTLWYKARAGLSRDEIQVALYMIANKIEASECEPRTRSGKKRRR